MFSVQSYEIRNKIRRRVTWIYVLAATVFVIINLPYIVLIFYDEVDETLTAINDACMICIVWLLCYSICKIRKFSRLLDKNEFKINESLMITHLVAFFGLTLFYIAVAGISLTNHHLTNFKEDMNTKQKRIKYSELILMYFEVPC